MTLQKPPALRRGDKVAIVSLSSGILGEEDCRHYIPLGTRRLEAFGLEAVFMPNALKGAAYLKERPEARAEDLKRAFSEPDIRGIICAIGGDDTYRLLPHLMDDPGFRRDVSAHPKLFSGFSDTTVNHLMFSRLGLASFYGPNFINDLCEMAGNMLPYTAAAFGHYLDDRARPVIKPSPHWYEERSDFSAAAVGTDRIMHPEVHGYELLQGSPRFEGRLLGGCVESLSDMLRGTRYADERAICERYDIFPSPDEWRDKILFLETSEETPAPEELKRMLEALQSRGVFDAISGMIVGKPQNERYYEAYKSVYTSVVGRKALPILYNVNFGHAYPRCVLPYGIAAKVNATEQTISMTEPLFAAAG